MTFFKGATRAASAVARSSALVAARRAPLAAPALATQSGALSAVSVSRAAPCHPALTRSYASHPHGHESFEDFTSRYVGFFEAVEDLFELQRGLNNCFAYDLVPAPEVIEAALKAARRVNDFPTAVRVFEGIREKVENQRQYEQYVEALKPVRDELGINLREELYSS
ncbi:unnamed protein product [Jaminaea pallidilutea]